jgi:hypothetical protein
MPSRTNFSPDGRQAPSALLLCLFLPFFLAFSVKIQDNPYNTVNSHSISCPTVDKKFLLKLPVGRPADVVLTGPERTNACEQLQAAVGNCLSLVMDSLTGKIIYTRNIDHRGKRIRITWEGKKLAKAIDDHTITVKVLASKSWETSTDSLLLGGAYMGNNVTGIYRTTFDQPSKRVLVETRQEVNTVNTGTISNYYEKPGEDMLHEVIESYIGGKYSQKSGISDKPAPHSLYYVAAHKAAPSQSGQIYIRSYGYVAPTATSAAQVDSIVFYVKTDNKNELKIRTLFKPPKTP